MRRAVRKSLPFRALVGECEETECLGKIIHSMYEY